MTRDWFKECHEGVTRKGEFEPCDKPAVAVRIDPQEGGPYPVCAYHARADMVLLIDLVDNIREQVAKEIEAHGALRDLSSLWRDGIDDAARIARGATS
jgi:hypothetical protein